MNTKQLFKGCVLGLAGMATLALALIVDVSPVAAHGERSQEPFLRMRTIQWYDMGGGGGVCSQAESADTRTSPYTCNGKRKRCGTNCRTRLLDEHLRRLGRL